MNAPRLLPISLAVVLLGGCLEEPSFDTRTGSGADPTGPPPARVLVLNTLSETLSELDLETNAVQVQAAVAGTWTNRLEPAAGGRRLLLTNSGANEVQILSAFDLKPVAALDLGAGRSPWTAVPVDGLRILVTNWLAGNVTLGTMSGVTIGDPLPVTPGPEGVALRGGRAWVACTNYRSEGGFGPGRVDVVDVTAWRVVASVSVGTDPQDLLFAEDGLLHVVCTGSPGSRDADGAVYVVDPSTRTVLDTVPVGGAPGRIAADSSGTIWTVGYEGGLRRYDGASRAPLPSPDDEALRGSGLSAVSYDAVRDALFVTHFELDLLLEVDRATATVTNVWPVGDGPVDVRVLRPGGSISAGRPRARTRS